jgi:hypothetical protein
MVYADCSWKPRDSKADKKSRLDIDSRQLALNHSVITIQSGTARLIDRRKSFQVERTIIVGERGQIHSYREGVDCAMDATIRAEPAAEGLSSERAKVLPHASPGVILPVDQTSAYAVNNGLFVSSADFAAAYDKRDAPFESVELLNRYLADVARLSVRGLLSHYGLGRKDCFASLMDLTLGIERPISIDWNSEDSAEITVANCPPRHRLRIYWPLKSCRHSSTLRRWWRTICHGLASTTVSIAALGSAHILT